MAKKWGFYDILEWLPVGPNEIAVYIDNLYVKDEYDEYITISHDQFHTIFEFTDPEEMNGQEWKMGRHSIGILLGDYSVEVLKTEKEFIEELTGCEVLNRRY